MPTTEGNRSGTAPAGPAPRRWRCRPRTARRSWGPRPGGRRDRLGMRRRHAAQAARAFSRTEASIFGWNCTTASCLPNARSKARRRSRPGTARPADPDGGQHRRRGCDGRKARLARRSWRAGRRAARPGISRKPLPSPRRYPGTRSTLPGATILRAEGRASGRGRQPRRPGGACHWSHRRLRLGRDLGVPGRARSPVTCSPGPRAESAARRAPVRGRPTPGRSARPHVLVVNGRKVRNPVFVLGAPCSAAPILARALKRSEGFHLTMGQRWVLPVSARLRAQPAAGPRPGGGGGDRAARRVRPGLAGQPALLPGMLRAVPGGGRGRGHRAVRGRPGH